MDSSKPFWLKKRLVLSEKVRVLETSIQSNSLHTICHEAHCPNQPECFSKGVATFLIMGNVCTRNCRFCAVASGPPPALDPDEPNRVAQQVSRLGLNFVVITSVSRDDLSDGGADHYVRVISALRSLLGDIGIELLIPDFEGSKTALRAIAAESPNVIGHNVETIPRLYSLLRPQANYTQSLALIEAAKKTNGGIVTKSGFMLGLGETKKEVVDLMTDLRRADCDIITIGQYLRPSPDHHPISEYIAPQDFTEYNNIALEMGFRSVASGPLVRSSYKAGDLYLQAVRRRESCE